MKTTKHLEWIQFKWNSSIWEEKYVMAKLLQLVQNIINFIIHNYIHFAKILIYNLFLHYKKKHDTCVCVCVCVS